MDFIMLFSFYFCWFYLRFFMTNKLNPAQFGDSSNNFALHSFFPESMQTKISEFNGKIFSIVNVFGIFDYLVLKFRSPLSNSKPLERKK
jgi:hypothetical protein